MTRAESPKTDLGRGCLFLVLFLANKKVQKEQNKSPGKSGLFLISSSPHNTYKNTVWSLSR